PFLQPNEEPCRIARTVAPTSMLAKQISRVAGGRRARTRRMASSSPSKSKRRERLEAKATWMKLQGRTRRCSRPGEKTDRLTFFLWRIGHALGLRTIQHCSAAVSLPYTCQGEPVCESLL